MKTLPPLRILIPIALFALACGTQGQPRVIAPVSPDTLVRTLAPDAPTLVSLQSLPDAACELGAAGVAETLKVRSDDRGVITFHALPIANADNTAQLTLTCTNAAGVQRVHPIQFEAGEAAVPSEVAAAAAIEALPHPGATVRPALVGDPNGYTSDQLVALGFPPRPDSDAAGGAYARWLSEVTQPMKVIPPNLRDSGLFHGPARGASSAPSSSGAASSSNSTSNNWSGLLLDGPKQYAAIFGWYPVPKVSAQSGFANSHSTSYWVGLDGWGSGDVVQDGSEALTVTFMWVQTTTYYAWAEYYPATESILWGFPVGPGDELGLWTILEPESYQNKPEGKLRLVRGDQLLARHHHRVVQHRGALERARVHRRHRRVDHGAPGADRPHHAGQLWDRADARHGRLRLRDEHPRVDDRPVPEPDHDQRQRRALHHEHRRRVRSRLHLAQLPVGIGLGGPVLTGRPSVARRRWSRRSRTLRRSFSGVSGFCRKAIRESSTPWRTTASSV